MVQKLLPSEGLRTREDYVRSAVNNRFYFSSRLNILMRAIQITKKIRFEHEKDTREVKSETSSWQKH